MLFNEQITRPFYGLYRAATPEAVQELYAEWTKSLQFFENQLISSGDAFFGGWCCPMALDRSILSVSLSLFLEKLNTYLCSFSPYSPRLCQDLYLRY